MKRAALLSKYSDHLVFRNYSVQTTKTYLRALDAFLIFCTTNSQAGTEVEGYAKAFLTQLFVKGYSWSSVNIHYSALRLLFINVLQREWDYKLLPRPKGRPSLPSVLSGRQVETMINHIKNLKHKTIILLLYSTGIRISELINIDRVHLLIDRAQLKIVKGKGGKDRIVTVPTTAMQMISIYLATYDPKVMLFDGDPKGKRYSRSSIHKIIKRAANQIGISFHPTAHSFRYAYATHHLELGTNLVTLQHQLGHSDASTTIKYVKLCKIQPRHTKHPVDLLSIQMPAKII